MTDQFKQELENSKGHNVFLKFLLSELKKPDLIEKFDLITELYLQVNSVINISALRNIDDIYIKHYLDSVYPHKYFRGRCCDVGCGGGFPCIPLSLVTGLNFIGIDGVGKKLTLIKKVADELSLNNITAEHCRAEELAKTSSRYDTVCARAVADTEKVISYCAPLVAKNGKLILYKTQNDDQATIKTLNKFGLRVEDVIDYELPETDIKRRLFIYSRSL